MNAADHGKHMKAVPVDSVAAFHPSGWVQTGIFTVRFDHFVKFIKP
jgi:hypothetical protein